MNTLQSGPRPKATTASLLLTHMKSDRHHHRQHGRPRKDPLQLHKGPQLRGFLFPVNCSEQDKLGTPGFTKALWSASKQGRNPGLWGPFG